MNDVIEKDTLCEYIHSTGVYSTLCIVRVPVGRLGEILGSYLETFNRYLKLLKDPDDIVDLFSHIIKKSMYIGDSEFVHTANKNTTLLPAIELLEDLISTGFAGIDPSTVLPDTLLSETQDLLLSIMCATWDSANDYFNSDEITVVTDVPLHNDEEFLLGYNKSSISLPSHVAGRIISPLDTNVVTEFMLFKRKIGNRY